MAEFGNTGDKSEPENVSCFLDIAVKPFQDLKDLFFLRMQHATNQLDNPLKIRETRHDIARVKTVLAELAARQ